MRKTGSGSAVSGSSGPCTGASRACTKRGTWGPPRVIRFGLSSSSNGHAVSPQSSEVAMKRSALAVLAVLSLSLHVTVGAQNAGLTAAEKQEGWTPLFDGQTLNGWATRAPGAGRGATQPPPTGKWAAENAELVWVKDSGRGYLVTDQVFNDFVLRLDFFVDAAANSGVNFGVPDTGNI